MLAFTPVSLALILIGQAQAPAGPGPRPGGVADDLPSRLKFMKKSLDIYRITPADPMAQPLRRQEEPAFRLGRQFGEPLIDGAIFFWTGNYDRPEAAVQVFLIPTANEPEGLWVHEFTSLSTEGLTANRGGGRVWHPTKPGLEFKPLPDAPKPAETESQRARQMHALSQGFRASDNFKARGWSELRILPKPIARYGKAGTELIDGSLFAFVLGTDPEVLLFLEARQGKNGPEWQYALAPMTVYAVKSTLQGKPVWELPDRQPSNDPSMPFFDLPFFL
jgi:hypothetical protein